MSTSSTSWDAASFPGIIAIIVSIIVSVRFESADAAILAATRVEAARSSKRVTKRVTCNHTIRQSVLHPAISGRSGHLHRCYSFPAREFAIITRTDTGAICKSNSLTKSFFKKLFHDLRFQIRSAFPVAFPRFFFTILLFDNDGDINRDETDECLREVNVSDLLTRLQSSWWNIVIYKK